MESLIKELRQVLGRRYVMERPEELLVYEYDASIERAAPQIVAVPADTEQVSRVVSIARKHGVPVVPRGAGTGLSGGAIPVQGGILMPLTRMNRILEIDAAERVAIVEPGVVNIDISNAAAPYGLRYAPDPPTQHACPTGEAVAGSKPIGLEAGATAAVECDGFAQGGAGAEELAQAVVDAAKGDPQITYAYPTDASAQDKVLALAQ